MARSAVRNRLELMLVQAVVGSIALLPITPGRSLARLYTALFDRIAGRLRRTGDANLQRALPTLDASARHGILQGLYGSLARVLLAFAHFPQINQHNIHRWIRYEGHEHYVAAKQRGRGVLFATAHLGNWELSAFAHALMTEPMHVVVRPLDNPLLDAYVERRRALSGNTIVSKRQGARAILRALQANQAVGILVDQNTSREEGVFVDFFGLPACTHTAFAKLAAHSGAAVLPGYALWSEAEQKHVLRFDAPLAMTGDVRADTQTVQSHLEQVIRAYPEQWLWLHRRWRTQPPAVSHTVAG